MNDENKSIHEFDVELICEYFSNLERQGPGSPEITINALSFIDNLNDKSLIADIGMRVWWTNNDISTAFTGKYYRYRPFSYFHRHFQPEC